MPGRDETLRVHGTARIRIDPELLARYAVNGKQPRSVIEIAVEGVRFHCGKALIRSKLWKAETQALAKELPSAGQMIADQVQGQSGEARAVPAGRGLRQATLLHQPEASARESNEPARLPR